MNDGVRKLHDGLPPATVQLTSCTWPQSFGAVAPDRSHRGRLCSNRSSHGDSARFWAGEYEYPAAAIVVATA